MQPSEGRASSWGPLIEVATLAFEIKHPVGLTQVPVAIPGPAFFPGGCGLVTADLRLGTKLPVGGIMVIGHNYGTVESYEDDTARGGEVEVSATWKGLRNVLTHAGIRLDECFFTNAFVGLLPPGSPEGSHEGHNDPTFLAACQSLIEYQIVKLQRPRLILTLGLVVPGFLAPLSCELSNWFKIDGYADLDGNRTGGPVRSASFQSHQTTVVALTHPCRPANRRFRSYEKKRGINAEFAMLRDGLVASARQSVSVGGG